MVTWFPEGAMRESYLVEHTVGSITRDASKIYFSHFWTLFLIYILPSFPVMVIVQETQRSGNTASFILSILLSLIVGWFAYAATTIAVSDICIGNAPSIKQSYGKVFGNIM